MQYESKHAREIFTKIVLYEGDKIICFREKTLTNEYSSHRVDISDLEYSKEDHAFVCPIHRVMLLIGI